MSNSDFSGDEHPSWIRRKPQEYEILSSTTYRCLLCPSAKPAMRLSELERHHLSDKHNDRVIPTMYTSSPVQPTSHRVRDQPSSPMDLSSDIYASSPIPTSPQIHAALISSDIELDSPVHTPSFQAPLFPDPDIDALFHTPSPQTQPPPPSHSNGRSPQDLFQNSPMSDFFLSQSVDGEESRERPLRSDEDEVNDLVSSISDPLDVYLSDSLSQCASGLEIVHQRLPDELLDIDSLAQDDDLDTLSDDGSESSLDSLESSDELPEFSSSQVDDPDGPWQPWLNAKLALFDIMASSPRAAMTRAGTEAVRWILDALGIPRTPGPRAQRRSQNRIRTLVGSDPHRSCSTEANLYWTCSLKEIIAHEMANPHVRPHLTFLPDDSGKYLNSPSQADRWRFNSPANLASPMARSHLGGTPKDYFVYEPCLVRVDSEFTPVIVTRFFTRHSNTWARVHPLVVKDSAFWINGSREFDVQLSNFHLNAVDFMVLFNEYKYPSPSTISGITFQDGHSAAWSEPVLNLWREKAQGREVVSVPIWLYCDDTSGNSSKKWNRHDSYLFILAGLDPAVAGLPHHIHFLSTSNLAGPTEQLEDISDQLRALGETGFTAYDCVKDDQVLCIPWVYAFQGDNPMSSETASHIGLGGNSFCRICGAGKTRDATDPDVVFSSGSSGPPLHQNMAQKALSFMSIQWLRSKAKTQHSLDQQLRTALDGYTSKVDDLQTESGVKDKRLTRFIERFRTAAKSEPTWNPSLSKQAREANAPLLRTVARQLAEEEGRDPFNPSLGIPGFDPNQHTPVEILHVILLGIVKYFWRDAVKRLNEEKRQLLMLRLSSFDVTSLGIPPLRGETLVKHAKSIVGGDFRMILQAAPAVLYGLLSDEAYDAWLALCRLSPLAFQISIPDRDVYLEDLRVAIDELLKATARWTVQWFNKPKFHLLLHLVKHVQEFGPAPRFATEGFESQNAVIRLRSVHSNHLAPSRDIALAFSLMHAVRHLLLGGWYFNTRGELRQAGPQVLRLLSDKRLAKLMGINLAHESEAGYRSYVLYKSNAVSWGTTRTSLHAAPRASSSNEGNLPEPSALVRQCRLLIMHDGDHIRPMCFALLREGGLVRILEIVQEGDDARQAIMLAHPWTIGSVVEPYHLPSIAASNGAPFLVRPDAVLCAVATFHNCHQEDCKPTRTRVVRQERVDTDHLTNEIRHSNPDNRILNLAQLRSAAHLQHFQGDYPLASLSREDAVRQGVIVHAETIRQKQAAAAPIGTEQG